MFLLVCVISLLGSKFVATQEVVNSYQEIVDNNIANAVQTLQNVNDGKNDTDNNRERNDVSLRTYVSLPFRHVVSRREQSEKGSTLKRRGFWSTIKKINTGVAVVELLGRDKEEKTYNDQSLRSYLSSPMHSRETSFESRRTKRGFWSKLRKIATGVAAVNLLGRDTEEKTYNDQSLRSYLSSPMHSRETSFESRHTKRGFWSTLGKIGTGIAIGAIFLGRNIESPSEHISNRQAEDLTVTLPDAKLFHQKLGDVTEAVDYLENVLQLEKENFANKNKN